MWLGTQEGEYKFLPTAISVGNVTYKFLPTAISVGDAPFKFLFTAISVGNATYKFLPTAISHVSVGNATSGKDCILLKACLLSIARHTPGIT